MRKTQRNLTALFALLLGISEQLYAFDGTITINGKVLDDGTCQVETGSRDQTVILPTVSTTQLATAGRTAGRTKFTIKLTACNAEDNGRARITFKNTNAQNGLLNNLTSNGASNVKIQLINATNEAVMPLDGQTADSAKVTNTVITQGGQQIYPQYDYYAQYYATGHATAGDVTATAEFEISYP